MKISIKKESLKQTLPWDKYKRKTRQMLFLAYTIFQCLAFLDKKKTIKYNTFLLVSQNGACPEKNIADILDIYMHKSVILI